MNILFSHPARRHLATLVAPGVAFLSLAALAAPPTTQTAPVQVVATSLVIGCARPALPPLQAFARLAGIDNFGRAYAVRASTMVEVQRECKRGPQSVRLVVAPAPHLEHADAILVAR